MKCRRAARRKSPRAFSESLQSDVPAGVVDHFDPRADRDGPLRRLGQQTLSAVPTVAGRIGRYTNSRSRGSLTERRAIPEEGFAALPTNAAARCRWLGVLDEVRTAALAAA